MELWCLMPLSNNISVISWQSVLLVEETGIPRILPQVTDKLYHTMLYRVHLAISWIRTHNFSGDEENSHVSVFVVYILKLDQFVFIGIERFSQNDCSFTATNNKPFVYMYENIQFRFDVP